MTKRRPHWDSDLVLAVGNLIVGEKADGETVYAVIAAVEDWARWEHVPKGTLARLERAEAAIARVRALHKVCTETPLDEGGCLPGDCDEPVCAHDAQAWPCATIRALGGAL